MQRLFSLSSAILVALILLSAIQSGAQSVEKEVLLPRLTKEQRDLLVNPLEGSVIYNKTAKKPQFYNGTAWKFFDINLEIGEQFGGGIIFYIDSTGEHGLVAAMGDQSNGAEWGFFEHPVGATHNAMGDGQSNTQKIIKGGLIPGIAARICDDLQLNGYDDWFLPSKDELNLLFINLYSKGLGNFDKVDYWSSSETDFNNAWLQNFKNGYAIEKSVKKTARVRAIRAF